MSKNPHYTGLQTFSIPFDQHTLIKGDITKPFTGSLVEIAGRSAQSAKQNVANAQNRIQNLIRPKPESAYSTFLPSYNPPVLEQFDLNMAAKRRSGDR
jgi:hypothetical protein